MIPAKEGQSESSKRSILLLQKERGVWDTFVVLLINRLAIVSTGWKTSSSATPAPNQFLASPAFSLRRLTSSTRTRRPSPIGLIRLELHRGRHLNSTERGEGRSGGKECGSREEKRKKLFRPAFVWWLCSGQFLGKSRFFLGIGCKR